MTMFIITAHHLLRYCLDKRTSPHCWFLLLSSWDYFIKSGDFSKLRPTSVDPQSAKLYLPFYNLTQIYKLGNTFTCFSDSLFSNWIQKKKTVSRCREVLCSLLDLKSEHHKQWDPFVGLAGARVLRPPKDSAVQLLGTVWHKGMWTHWWGNSLLMQLKKTKAL